MFRKQLLEVGYDWYSKTVVSYTWGESENSLVVLETISGIFNVIKKYEINSILQMDRGAANTSYLIKEYEDSQTLFKISMSKAGFKHNSPTESMNGWLKDSFFASHGNSFLNINDFRNKFKTFIINHNKSQYYKYSDIINIRKTT